jgi:hypothetical protein
LCEHVRREQEHRFLFGQEASYRSVSTKRELAVQKDTHPSCMKGALMKASFESVKFSVRRCRRGGHWKACGPPARPWWRSLGRVKGLEELSSSSWGLKMRCQRPLKIRSLPTLMTVLQLCGRRLHGMLLSPPVTHFHTTHYYASFEKSYVLPIVDLIRALFSAHPISFVSFLNASLTGPI